MYARELLSARQRLRRATGQIHDALHDHPVFGLLESPEISAGQYVCALRAFRSFFDGIENERLRHGRWAAFSLAEDCSALSLDVGAGKSRAMPIEFHSAHALLGGLYVAHGAAFGRASLSKRVLTNLPRSSHAFFSLPVRSGRWRTLVACLECEGSAPESYSDIVQGARLAFSSVSQLTPSDV